MRSGKLPEAETPHKSQIGQCERRTGQRRHRQAPAVRVLRRGRSEVPDGFDRDGYRRAAASPMRMPPRISRITRAR